MLSRVAEHIYWLARYVERTENVARLITVNSHLQLDLPRTVRPGWEPLIAIAGATETFYELHNAPTGQHVIDFLIADVRNPGSIVSSVRAARENARTIRDVIPRDAWEQINEYYRAINDGVQQGLSAWGRYDYLKRVILGAQTLTGLLSGTMNHDVGYAFLRLGRNLERADMTTRIIDVRTANLLPNPSGLRPFESIQWMSVLKSLTGYQMYRREMQAPVLPAIVLRFLLKSRQFPRAFLHCMGEMENALHELPNPEGCLETITRIQNEVLETDPSSFEPEQLHQYIDDLQLGLADMHNAIGGQYFYWEQ